MRGTVVFNNITVYVGSDNTTPYTDRVKDVSDGKVILLLVHRCARKPTPTNDRAFTVVHLYFDLKMEC